MEKCNSQWQAPSCPLLLSVVRWGPEEISFGFLFLCSSFLNCWERAPKLEETAAVMLHRDILAYLWVFGYTNNFRYRPQKLATPIIGLPLVARAVFTLLPKGQQSRSRALDQLVLPLYSLLPQGHGCAGLVGNLVLCGPASPLIHHLSKELALKFLD